MEIRLNKLELEKSAAIEKGNNLKAAEIENEMKLVKERIEYLLNMIQALTNDPEHPENSKTVDIKDIRIHLYKVCYRSSVVGDAVGDSLKDSVAPTLKILVRFYSLLALTFASLFVSTSYLYI
jgi:hypothetical protein